MDAHHDPIDQKCTQMRSVCTAAHAAEQAVGGLSDTLETPTPFAAADVIAHDDDGRLSFHYAIVEVTHPQPHAVWPCQILEEEQHSLPQIASTLRSLCVLTWLPSAPQRLCSSLTAAECVLCKCRWPHSCRIRMRS